MPTLHEPHVVAMCRFTHIFADNVCDSASGSWTQYYKDKRAWTIDRDLKTHARATIAIWHSWGLDHRECAASARQPIERCFNERSRAAIPDCAGRNL